MCNYHPKNSLMFHFHLDISSMYMWKNIFHIIIAWHKDILKIFCPHHHNIPNIFVLVHMLMLTLTCSLPSVVGPTRNNIFAFFGNFVPFNKNDLCQIQFKEDLGLLLAKKLFPLSFVEAPFLKIE